ncbi:deoxynucleoside kinase [Kitasatospora aureofaciens]|uniref:dTMP kinase n=1 Tax=Kitasatospora aureofaciens TaxID=1894 RepID=UPI001C482F81|nr:deoxynucleoside kinase [Kitasatospora aureofaciens]MBV6700379.1 deoxynucleoside kinase [Kitasatospora aureofaciens]
MTSELPACYQPPITGRNGILLALEGISGSGKSTLTALLAERLHAETLHVIPQPLSSLIGYINDHGGALTQFAFHLAGALDAADSARHRLVSGNLIADRWIGSVVVNHAAVNNLDLDVVIAMFNPHLSYLPRPDLTVYLETSEKEIRHRMEARPGRAATDRFLTRRPSLLGHVQELYRLFAATDPTAVPIATDERTPEEIATEIHDLLEAHRAAAR